MWAIKQCLCFTILLLLFLSIFSMSGNSSTIPPVAPYPLNIPTKFTPFNKTTILTWEPWTVDNPKFLSDLTPMNQTFGVHKGVSIPFYSTLLPMYPNLSSIRYSMQILNFSGNSNIFVNMSCLLASVVHGTSLTTQYSIDPCKSVIALNSNINNSITGSLFLNNINDSTWTSGSQYQYLVYSYAMMMQNITSNFAYSVFSLQPEPINKTQAWNYTLSIRVSIAGLEDKAFFDYMHTSKGIPTWNSTSFIPKQQLLNPNSGMQQLEFGPMDQSNLEQSTPPRVIFISNDTHFMNDFLDLNLYLQTSSALKVNIEISRSIFSDFGTVTYTVGVSTFLLVNNTHLDYQLNWEKINRINFTIFGIKKISSDSFLLSTSLGNASYTGFNSTFHYQTVDEIAIYLETPNLIWDNWANVLINTTWKKDNPNIPNNTALLSVISPNNHTSIYSLNFSNTNSFIDLTSTNMLSSNPPTTPSFTMIDLMGSILIVSILIPIFLKKRKNKNS